MPHHSAWGSDRVTQAVTRRLIGIVMAIWFLAGCVTTDASVDRHDHLYSFTEFQQHATEHLNAARESGANAAMAVALAKAEALPVSPAPSPHCRDGAPTSSGRRPWVRHSVTTTMAGRRDPDSISDAVNWRRKTGRHSICRSRDRAPRPCKCASARTVNPRLPPGVGSAILAPSCDKTADRRWQRARPE